MKHAFLALLIAGVALAAQAGPPRQESSQPMRHVLMPDFSALVKNQGPAVVNILVTREVKKDASGHDPGIGSGFVVTPNGIILTNSHVIAGASKIAVRFIDKRELPARVLGVDELTDVAVLKVEADGLPVVTLGNSAQLEVGQWVLAIGAPLGLERTATQGIVSALGRSLPNDNYVPFIQTDVPINPGNSGGPLFDIQGQVIGINSQIVTHTGGYMGLSFAIPINIALAVSKQILANGHARHGWLGASAQDLSQALAHAYGQELPHGALINQVRPGGPAERAGVQVGDIVQAFDDMAILDSADLPPAVGIALPGERHRLTVLREGNVLAIDVVLGDVADAGKPATPTQRFSLLGLTAHDVNGLVRVAEIMPGPAAEAGIRPGDVLLQIGRASVGDTSRLRELESQLLPGHRLPVLIGRGEDRFFLPLSLPAKPRH